MSRFSKCVLGGSIAVLVACGAALATQGGGSSQDEQLLAQVGSQSITASDLAKAQPAKMLAVRYKVYEVEREALQQQVDQVVLEQEAKRQGITVDQLLDREVTSKVKTPSEEALRVYYEGINTDTPYEQVRSQIIDQIRKQRTDKARAAYMKSLREKSHVTIALAPPEVTGVVAGDAPSAGPKDAPITFVEFADYECPYCQKVEPSVKKIREQYGDKVRFVFKTFPLPMHPHAQKAGEAALCAGEQGKYWQYHDALYEKGPRNLEIPQLKELAGSLKLDTNSFDHCLDSGKEQAAVKATLDEAVKLGLSGTPSFFINGHFVSGALGYDDLRQLVDQQLTNGHPTAQAAQQRSVASQ